MSRVACGRGSRTRKGAAHDEELSVGVLIAALLISGTLVGVSFGGGGGITEPEVIELLEPPGCAVDDNDPNTFCRVYNFKDDEGLLTGETSRFRVAVSDVDGNHVGWYFLQCDGAKSTGRTCSEVLRLKEGPYTERGTIVAMGVGLPPAAIVGGSGAYLNAHGEMSGEIQRDDHLFHLFVKLIP